MVRLPDMPPYEKMAEKRRSEKRQKETEAAASWLMESAYTSIQRQALQDNPRFRGARKEKSQIGDEQAAAVLSAAGQIAAGFIPGEGVADFLGYLPKVDVTGKRLGELYPSAFENIKSGEYGEAALQALGLVGEAVPILGLGVDVAQYRRGAMSAADKVGGGAPDQIKTEALRRQVLERGKSGRPLKSERLKIGTEKGIMDAAMERVTDYRGMHTAPMKEAGYRNTLDNLSDIYPDDLYSVNGARYYGHGGDSVRMDEQTVGILRRFRNKPNATVTVYRAVPHEPTIAEQLATLDTQMAAFLRRGKTPPGAEISGSAWYNGAHGKREQLRAMLARGEESSARDLGINAGDWVTVNRAYAKGHGESNLGGQYKIISKKVRASDLASSGDSIHEFGYVPDPKPPSITSGPRAAPRSQRLKIGTEELIVDEILDRNGKSIRVFHGSPHDFDKFSMEKIGTGEGAQTYGHGLYFAEKEGTAKTYRDTLSDPVYVLNGKPIDAMLTRGASGDEGLAANALWRFKGDKQGAIENLKEYGDFGAAKYLESATVEKSPGRMYEARLRASPDEFLDWDKPLSEQPENIKQMLGSVADKTGFPIVQGNPVDVEDVLRDLQLVADNDYGLYQKAPQVSRWLKKYQANPNDPQVRLLINNNFSRATGIKNYLVEQEREFGMSTGLLLKKMEDDPAAVSAKLREAGIKGIKYLDQFSRDAGEGSLNYVVFDDSIIKIIRKFGLAGLTTLGAGAALMGGGTEAKAAPKKPRKTIMEGN